MVNVVPFMSNSNQNSTSYYSSAMHSLLSQTVGENRLESSSRV